MPITDDLRSARPRAGFSALRALLTIAALTALTACASPNARSSAPGRLGGTGHAFVKPPSSTGAASSSTAGALGDSPTGGAQFNQSATTLMAEVPGCHHPPSLTTTELASVAWLHGMPNLLSAVSTASRCDLRGQIVVLLTFATAGTQHDAIHQLHTFPSYYSDGTGWIALPATTAVPVSGLSAVQEVAGILGGSIAAGGGMDRHG